MTLHKTIRREHFRNLVAVAGSDGSFLEIEKDFLIAKAIKLGLSQEEVDEIFKNAKSLSFIVPEKEVQKKEQLAEIVYIALIDGMLRKVEYDLCLRIALRLGFSQEYLDDVIDEVKRIWRSRNHTKTKIIEQDPGKS